MAGTGKAAWIFVFQLVQLQKKLQVLHFKNAQDTVAPSLQVWEKHVYIKRRKFDTLQISQNTVIFFKVHSKVSEVPSTFLWINATQ
jgi:hypothetical protein